MEKLDLCIPAFNEGAILKDTLIELIPFVDALPVDEWRILVVDNNSSDNTREVVESFPHSRIEVVQESTPGKGAAVKSGARASNADYFAFVDADLSANPRHLYDLFKHVQGGYDIAVGSRFVDPQKVHRSFWRTATARLFQTYAQFVVPVPVMDSQCGLKLMNKRGKEVLLSCKDNGWFFDREFLAKATKRNLTIVETPVMWEEFRYSGRKSKLNLLEAGLGSLYKLILIRMEVHMFK